MELLLSIFSSILKVENTITISLCSVVFALVFRYFRRNSYENLPPGPWQWPVLGNLPLMLHSRVWLKQHSHELMTELAGRYGKIFTIRMPGGPASRIIVLNDFKMIKEAFQRRELSDRRPIRKRYLERTGGQGVLQASGKIWKHQRRFSMTTFRGFGVGKTSFDDIVEIEGNQLSDAVREACNRPFNVRQLLMNATSNMICTIGFGKRFEYKDPEFRRLSAILDERVRLSAEVQVYSQLPLYRYVRSGVVKRLLKAVSDSMAYFHEIVEDHKIKLTESGGQCGDLTDLYLKEMQEDSREDDGDTAVATEGNLVNLVDHLFAAGTETSSNTLAWCLLRVIAEPELQEKIRDEIRTVCGGGEEGRMPRYSDRINMPFTEAVILEVQRLHTIVPLALPHCAAEDTTLQGYTIPKGSLVMGNLWAVHHDPEVWNEPEVFRPSRFIDQDGHVTIKEEWTPFSIGRRICLGEKLAKMEIFIFFTHLLARFTFRKPDHVSSVSFKGRSGVTFGPEPFEICAEPISCL